MNLDSITTFEQLDALKLEDLVKNLHVVIGPNGMCLCGTYGNQVLTCAEIVSMKSFELRSALLIASFPTEIDRQIKDQSK